MSNIPNPNHPPYSKVWRTIKERGKAELAADPKLHKRIKKAVIKKKGEDILYKMELLGIARKAELVIISRGHILSFELKFYVLDSVLARSLGRL